MATTLITTLYNLARYPAYQEQIRSELQGVSISDFVAVIELPILKSIIMETLRLWPPIPTGKRQPKPLVFDRQCFIQNLALENSCTRNH